MEHVGLAICLNNVLHKLKRRSASVGKSRGVLYTDSVSRLFGTFFTLYIYRLSIGGLLANSLLALNVPLV